MAIQLDIDMKTKSFKDNAKLANGKVQAVPEVSV
jgi:hypothetical protein